jgi:hypothetical protein
MTWSEQMRVFVLLANLTRIVMGALSANATLPGRLLIPTANSRAYGRVVCRRPAQTQVRRYFHCGRRGVDHAMPPRDSADSPIAITANIYVHVSPAMLHGAAKLLDWAVASAGNVSEEN